MAQPAPLPPAPQPIDLTLEELLSQFDDEDFCGNPSPPPPVPPTSSLEQYDYIEELDRLLLQHDDAQRQHQAHSQVQSEVHPRQDCDLLSIELPPPEGEAASLDEEQNAEAVWTSEDGSAMPQLLLLPPPDEYKDMEEVAVRRPSLLLQALAAPVAVVAADVQFPHTGGTEGLDDGAALAHLESGLANARDVDSYEQRQEQDFDYGSQSLAVEPCIEWSGGEVYGNEGQHPDPYFQYQDHLQLPQVQEQRTPETTALGDLAMFRTEKFKARTQNCPVQFNNAAPPGVVSPCSQRTHLQVAPPSIADTDSGIESVSSLSPPEDADGEMSPMCSPPMLSLSAKKPVKLTSFSVLSTILSREPEPTKSSTLLNSLLINNNNMATSATPNPMPVLSMTEAEDSSTVEAAVCSLKVLAINPKDMTLSKESRDARGDASTSETDHLESTGGVEDPTGLSFLLGDGVPIRSALEDEDATSRLTRRKRSASEMEEPWAKEAKGGRNHSIALWKWSRKHDKKYSFVIFFPFLFRGKS